MKTAFPYLEASEVGDELCAALDRSCQRLIVTGSLRRLRSSVGDVEVLYISKIEERPLDMFASVAVALAEEEISHMEKAGVLERRLNVNGSETYGVKNKLMLHRATSLPVDLFATTEENWWVSLVVRTGSKETNLRLTTGAQKMGRSLMAYGCGVRESNGNVIPATSEEHVFELCGVPYLKPEDR